MTLTTIALVWMAYSTIGGIIAVWFLYVWGWGDAGYGVLKPSDPNDLWHRRRRLAFYLVAIWACVGNPIALMLLGLCGRQIFRRGVWDVDNGITHKRWYGG